MRNILPTDFKNHTAFINFLKGVFASGIMAAPYDCVESVALLISAMQEGLLRIVEYDFCLRSDALWGTNNAYEKLAMRFRGSGSQIDPVRRAAYSLLPDGCDVTVEDGSDFYVRNPDMLVCMGNKKLEYLYKRMEAYGANTAYLMFPYLYLPDDAVESSLGIHQFYRITAAEKFLEMLAAEKERRFEAMCAAVYSIDGIVPTEVDNDKQ